MITLRTQPLTAASFKPFGEVVEICGAQHFAINQGFAERFDDLASVDVTSEGGAINVSIVSAKPRPCPVALAFMERHPLGTQMFYPLQIRPWLVVVCSDPHDQNSFRTFSASGLQGINYAKGAWHYPLLVLEEDNRFLVVDRKGGGSNLDEVALNGEIFCSVT